MKVQTSTEKRRKMRRSLEHRSGNQLRVNLFSTPTKRRKRNEQNNQKTLAESFIMKLFDRSLDLSKYSESTPLYPICRAWMANQPRNSNINNYRERSLPSKRENNGADLLRRIQRGDSAVINAMPAPLNIEVPKMPKFINENPDLGALDKVLFPKEVDDSTDDEKIGNVKAALLADHKKKWIKTKINWLKHARNCDKRYELNQLILKKIFKP